MRDIKTHLLKVVFAVADSCAVPMVIPAAFLLKTVRRVGLNRLALCRESLLRIGVLPVRNHYYEPFFEPGMSDYPEAERTLPGIKWNEAEQLTVLDQFAFASELEGIPKRRQGVGAFYVDNPSFGPGDFESLYQMIRLKKPRRLIEVGSGMSSLVAMMAIKRNAAEDREYSCQLTCIEPYEQPWLEQTGAEIIRKRVEELDIDFFTRLEANDVLFIDSSHVVRSQGDVTFEYLNILPVLAPGVIVHVHDIFTPKDYPRAWIAEERRLWTEQYLLEAFLSCNDQWKILLAANYLRHKHFDAFKTHCPSLKMHNEPGSFYMQRLA